jgi:hypothetical protein
MRFERLSQSMSGHANILPETLERTLTDLGRAVSKGNVPEALLTDALSGLAALPPQAVVSADAQIARLAGLYTPWSPSPDPMAGRRPSFALLQREPRLAALFLFHRDGFIREAALDRSAKPPASPFFLAALAWRLNDWADQVRSAARDCAARLFPLTDADVVVGAAPLLLDRWRRWQRWGPEEIAIIDSMLRRPDVAERLVKDRFAKRLDGPLARELKYALRGPSLDPHLPFLAREAKHPAVRATALQALLQASASWPIGFGQEWIDKSFGRSRRVILTAKRPLTTGRISADDVIREGLRDRSSLVRRVAADALIERPGTFPGIDEVIARLNRDRSGPVRERADFLARKWAAEAQSS